MAATSRAVSTLLKPPPMPATCFPNMGLSLSTLQALGSHEARFDFHLKAQHVNRSLSGSQIMTNPKVRAPHVTMQGR